MNNQQFPGTNPFTARKTAMGCRRTPAISPVFLLLLGAGLCGVGKISPLLAQDGALRPISGLVLAEDTGKPVANALVRVSSPAPEMRSVRGPRQGLYDARTDANGRFTVQVPQNHRISLNAFARGYGEAARMWMSANGTFQDVPFPSSQEPELKIKLRPALYVAGVVANESGHSFSGAAVEASLEGENFTGYVAFDTTDANGRFEIFDFPLKPEAYGNPKVRGQLTFQNPTKLTSIINNVYAMSEMERTNLHVTLGSGHEIKGVIASAAGPPIPSSKRFPLTKRPPQG